MTNLKPTSEDLKSCFEACLHLVDTVEEVKTFTVNSPLQQVRFDRFDMKDSVLKALDAVDVACSAVNEILSNHELRMCLIKVHKGVAVTIKDRSSHSWADWIADYANDLLEWANKDWAELNSLLKHRFSFWDTQPFRESLLSTSLDLECGFAVMSLPMKDAGGNRTERSLQDRLDLAYHALSSKQKVMFQKLIDMKPHKIADIASVNQSDEAAKKMAERIGNKLLENANLFLYLDVNGSSYVLGNLAGQN